MPKLSPRSPRAQLEGGPAQAQAHQAHSLRGTRPILGTVPADPVPHYEGTQQHPLASRRGPSLDSEPRRLLESDAVGRARRGGRCAAVERRLSYSY